MRASMKWPRATELLVLPVPRETISFKILQALNVLDLPPFSLPRQDYSRLLQIDCFIRLLIQHQGIMIRKLKVFI